MQWAQKRTGFTIVELLIVVVVIAILATIIVVAYNGIQNNAKNAAIIDAVAKSKRLIQAYVALNNDYPLTSTSAYVCITTQTTCRRNNPDVSGNSTLDNELNTIGTPPKTAPLVSDVRGGVTYNYLSSRTVDGVSAPVILSYYITGVNSDCGLTVVSGEGAASSTLTSKYTNGNVGSSGVTQCVVSVQ